MLEGELLYVVAPVIHRATLIHCSCNLHCFGFDFCLRALQSFLLFGLFCSCWLNVNGFLLLVVHFLYFCSFISVQALLKGKN